jgi:F0F1-type ATP synthase delta subunit
MSDNYTYSRPYGEAAFKMALEGNVIDQWSDNLKTLSKVIADKDIKAVLADPKISQSACASLLLGFLILLIFCWTIKEFSISVKFQKFLMI